MSDVNKPKFTPVAQEPHTADDCRINENPHNHPEVDCGHAVPGYGPGNLPPEEPVGPGYANN